MTRKKALSWLTNCSDEQRHYDMIQIKLMDVQAGQRSHQGSTPLALTMTRGTRCHGCVKSDAFANRSASLLFGKRLLSKVDFQTWNPTR